MAGHAKHKLARFFAILAALNLILGFILPLSLKAQNSAANEIDRLNNLRKTHEQRAKALEDNASKAEGDIRALQQKLVEAATDVKKAEITAIEKQQGLKEVASREKQARDNFFSQRQALENVVIALIAIERDRPPILAIRPANATEAARVAILMRLIAPMLDQKARLIAAQITKLQQIRQEMLMRDTEYRNAVTILQNANKTAAILIAQRQSQIQQLRQSAAQEQGIIVQIAQKASGLRDLVNRLGAALPDNDADNPAFAHGFSDAKGHLVAPVIGIIVQKFGENLSEGGKSSGITIRTRQSAQVVSPYDGRVEFASDFRSYGRVLIINVGDSYRVVMAGLGTSYVEAGQQILAGEPVGTMNDDKNAIPDLYFEIRKGEETVNPQIWLGQNATKPNAF